MRPLWLRGMCVKALEPSDLGWSRSGMSEPRAKARIPNALQGRPSLAKERYMARLKAKWV